MKLLSEILYRVRMVQVTGGANVAIEHITIDSRSIRPMSVFVVLS